MFGRSSASQTSLESGNTRQYCTQSASVGTFCFKHGHLNTKPVTILVLETKTTKPAEKLSWFWFSHFEPCLAIVSVFFFFFLFFCSNRNVHQLNDKGSSTALFQIQLVSHSNSLPIILQ